MSKLIPVLYNNKQYPEGIQVKVQEIAAHFDIKAVNPHMQYSLHTEYSYGKRSFKSPYAKGLDVITASHKNGVPQLWKNEKWSLEFAEYIIKMVPASSEPKIIEIHPPFNDYCKDIHQFLDVYSVFEEAILEKFRNVEILIENRTGTIYTGGSFLISNVKSLLSTANLINTYNLKLGIVLDTPQLFTAHRIKGYDLNPEMFSDIFRPLYDIRNNIRALHLWGKYRNHNGRVVAHQGDLNTYFESEKMKNIFLNELVKLFNDDIARYFVPEVNSGSDDVISIVNDLIRAGFIFV